MLKFLHLFNLAIPFLRKESFDIILCTSSRNIGQHYFPRNEISRIVRDCFRSNLKVNILFSQVVLFFKYLFNDNKASSKVLSVIPLFQEFQNNVHYKKWFKSLITFS